MNEDDTYRILKQVDIDTMIRNFKRQPILLCGYNQYIANKDFIEWCKSGGWSAESLIQSMNGRTVDGYSVTIGELGTNIKDSVEYFFTKSRFSITDQN